MSIRIIDHVLRHSKQSGSALLVLIILADWANDGGYCFPSVVSISKKARLTKRQLQKIVSKLVEDGELEVQYGKGVFTKTGPTNRFIITTPERAEWDASVASENDWEGVSSTTPLGGRGVVHDIPQYGSDGVTEDQGVSSTTPITVSKDKRSKDSVAAQRAQPKPRKKDLAFEAVRGAFGLSNGGVVQLHVQMLTGVDTGKNTEWNRFRVEPGLTAWEIAQFGDWMKERAEEMDVSAPRKPETIARWVEDWRAEIEEDILLDALRRSQTIYEDENGEDVMFSKEAWLENIYEERKRAEELWNEEHS